MASVLGFVATGSEELENLVAVAEWDSGRSSDVFNGFGVTAQLGSVSLVSIAFSTSTANAGAGAHNTSVDAARHAVLLLDVDLWQEEETHVVGRVLLDISPGGAVNHLSHLETLDSFVLGHAAGAVDAPHNVGMSLVFLPSSVVPSL